MVNRQYSSIGNETVRKAAECQKNHACLSFAGFKPCDVQYVSLNAFCALKQECESACNYCLSLDGQNICGCPVRREIYSQYKV